VHLQSRFGWYVLEKVYQNIAGKFHLHSQPDWVQVMACKTYGTAEGLG